MYTETQLLIRNTVRDFSRKELAPGAAARDNAKEFPGVALRRLGELGYMGMLVAEEGGGAGFDHVSYSLAIAEIAAADGACSTIVSVHNSLVCSPIEAYGTPDQRATFLAPLASGRQLGAFCLTEPNAGSDASAIETTARPDDGGYVLNGTKCFITSGQSADIALVFALTDRSSTSGRISAFIVPTDSAGYNVVRVENTAGQRSSDHCQIELRDCWVSRRQLLGEEGAGMRIALGNLAVGRIGVAAQSLGMARAAFELAMRYAQERRTFGKTLYEHQSIAFRLADMGTAISAAELLVWKAARARDFGASSALKDASMAKLFASEAAEKVASGAIQILGGYGYLHEYQVERIYRDVRACTIYEGASEIQRLVISRELARELQESKGR